MGRQGKRNVLPGFRITLGFTVFYLCLIVIVPLLTLPARTAAIHVDHRRSPCSSNLCRAYGTFRSGCSTTARNRRRVALVGHRQRSERVSAWGRTG